MTGGRDGCLNFWKVENEFSHISKIKLENIGGMKYDEIISLLYLKASKQLLLGMMSGQVLVYGVLQGNIVDKTNVCR